jgi:hypothetical protein
MIKVIRKEFYRSSGRLLLQYGESSPEGVVPPACPCGCVTTIDSRPLGVEPSNIDLGFKVLGQVGPFEFNMCLSPKKCPAIYVYWEPIDEEEDGVVVGHRGMADFSLCRDRGIFLGISELSNLKTHRYQVFSNAGEPQWHPGGLPVTILSTQGSALDALQGTADMQVISQHIQAPSEIRQGFSCNLYFGHDLDTSRLYNGHSPTKIDLSAMDGRVWMHQCEFGCEVTRALTEEYEIQGWRDFKANLERANCAAISHANLDLSVKEIHDRLTADSTFYQSSTEALAWALFVLEKLIHMETYSLGLENWEELKILVREKQEEINRKDDEIRCH